MSLPPDSLLDTAPVDADTRFALFQAGLGASHDVYRVADDDRPFEARLAAWLVDDMIITAGRQMSVRIVRTAERIRADGLDYITVMLVRRGTVTGSAEGPVTWGAGEIGVLDLALPVDLVTSDNENIGVRLPRAALVRAGSPQALHGRVIRGTAARIVAGHLSALVEYASDIPDRDKPQLVRATAAIVAARLADLDTPPPASARGTRIRIAAHVGERLTDRTLDVASIAGALSLSRPTLYRAMRPHGGVAAYVVARRLDAIHALLADPTEPRTITALAFDHGFASYAHFSTAFRRRFGYEPRAARAAAIRQSGGSGATATAYRAWLRGLARVYPPSPQETPHAVIR